MKDIVLSFSNLAKRTHLKKIKENGHAQVVMQQVWLTKEQ
jgi:hypothetical protein